MVLNIKGTICVDCKTKNLIKRIEPGQIAVISHPDLDEIAALSLVEAKVKAVINAESAVTGKYPNLGPEVLLKAGIPLIDNAGREIMNLDDNEVVTIKDNKIIHQNKVIGKGQVMTPERLKLLQKETEKNIDGELKKFINNTLQYAIKEKELILNEANYPKDKNRFSGQTCCRCC